MGNQYVSEVRLMSFNYAPTGWAMCNGSVLAIQANSALFALVGTTYGGNGVQTFALPDLRGRAPLSMGQAPGGSNYVIGQASGQETHTLSIGEIPVHTHTASASLTHATTDPLNAYPAGGGAAIFAPPSSLAAMSSNALANTGSNQPHANQQPYLVMTWCIALTGIFPSRS